MFILYFAGEIPYLIPLIQNLYQQTDLLRLNIIKNYAKHRILKQNEWMKSQWHSNEKKKSKSSYDRSRFENGSKPINIFWVGIRPIYIIHIMSRCSFIDTFFTHTFWNSMIFGFVRNQDTLTMLNVVINTKYLYVYVKRCIHPNIYSDTKHDSWENI